MKLLMAVIFCASMTQFSWSMNRYIVATWVTKEAVSKNATIFSKIQRWNDGTEGAIKAVRQVLGGTYTNYTGFNKYTALLGKEAREEYYNLLDEYEKQIASKKK